MSERIGVTITATDGASRVFAAVANGADKLEQSLERSEQSASRFSRSGAAMGAAAGALTGVLSNAARASAEAQISTDRLQASIEATGALYEEYADRVEAAGDAAVQMAFDDEDAADALSFLTQATGDANTAINDLGLVMDIARGRGIGLAEAAKIVAAAEQGRFTTLRRIGIQLDENATKEDAIAALQQKYAGQAQAYADSEAGSYDRIIVKLNNLNEALGDHTGQLQGVLMMLPGLSAGYTALAAALGGLSPLLGGAGVAGTAGPILGVAAFAAAMYGAMELAWPDDEKPHELSQQAETLAKQIDIAMQVIQTSGDRTATTVGANTQSILKDSSNALDQIELLNGRIFSNQQALNTLNPGSAQYEQRSQQLKQDQADLARITMQYGDWTGATEGQVSAEQALLAALTYTGTGRELALKDIDAINKRFAAGEITFDDWATGIHLVGSQLSAYDIIAERSGKTTEKTTSAVNEQTAAMQANAAYRQKASEELLKQVDKQSAAFEQQYKLTTNAYTGVFDAQAAGFRIAVQNTNAIGQQSQAVADWAENLIGAQGAYSKLDDLVNAGRISGESGEFDAPTQYAAAQRAYNSILEDNAAIQEHIAAIQAMQAPLQAQLLDQEEKRLAALEQATPEQQMLALAYMDSATSMQAMQLAQGLISDRDTFGPMIEQLAEANPYLRSILEDLGLIAVDHNGQVSILGVDSAKSQLDTLNTAISQLVMAQWIAMFGGNTEAAEAAYERVMGDAEAWDNLTASATLTVDDYASGAINAVQMSLNELDGRAVTTYINTVSTFSGDSYSPLGGGARALGGVAGYDQGGVVIRAGEAGAERFDYPGGGHGIAWTDGLYSVPRGTYVNTAPATATGNWGSGPLIGELHVHATGSDEEVAERVTRVIVPAIQRAMRQHVRATGGEW